MLPAAPDPWDMSKTPLQDFERTFTPKLGEYLRARFEIGRAAAVPMSPWKRAVAERRGDPDYRRWLAERGNRTMLRAILGGGAELVGRDPILGPIARAIVDRVGGPE